MNCCQLFFTLFVSSPKCNLHTLNGTFSLDYNECIHFDCALLMSTVKFILKISSKHNCNSQSTFQFQWNFWRKKPANCFRFCYHRKKKHTCSEIMTLHYGPAVLHSKHKCIRKFGLSLSLPHCLSAYV